MQVTYKCYKSLLKSLISLIQVFYKSTCTVYKWTCKSLNLIELSITSVFTQVPLLHKGCRLKARHPISCNVSRLACPPVKLFRGATS